MNNKTKLQSLCDMGQSCQCTVHIQVCLHNWSICSGIYRSWWGWLSQKLLVVNPKVWLHHHIGNNRACTPKLASSDTFLQAKQCYLVEAAKEADNVVSQLQPERADNIIEGAVGLAAKFEVQLSNPCWKTKIPLKCSHLHIKSVLEEAKWTTCRKWTHDCQWHQVTTWLSTSHGNNWCIWHQKEQSSCTKCSKMTCLEISVNYKMKLSLEGKIGIMNVADTLDSMVQDISPDLNPNMYTAVIILVVMSVSTITKSDLSAQCGVSWIICALQWQLRACRDWICTSTKT